MMLGALVIMWAAAPAQANGQLRLPVEGDVAVSAYFDHDGVDWACGERVTPDHAGTDLALPGGFAQMDEGVAVVAAAPGFVVLVVDGIDDRCSSGDCGQDAGGNRVLLRHLDGTSTLYAHLRLGSVAVEPDTFVEAGTFLGEVGSSGWSTGPHLHFELQDSLGRAVDPFAGPCGGGSSAWADQGAYLELPGGGCGGYAITPLVVGTRQCGLPDCAELLRQGEMDGRADLFVGETLLLRLAAEEGCPAVDSLEVRWENAFGFAGGEGNLLAEERGRAVLQPLGGTPTEVALVAIAPEAPTVVTVRAGAATTVLELDVFEPAPPAMAPTCGSSPSSPAALLALLPVLVLARRRNAIRNAKPVAAEPTAE